jgi:hypothetical protein
VIGAGKCVNHYFLEQLKTFVNIGADNGGMRDTSYSRFSRTGSVKTTILQRRRPNQYTRTETTSFNDM